MSADDKSEIRGALLSFLVLCAGCVIAGLIMESCLR